MIIHADVGRAAKKYFDPGNLPGFALSNHADIFYSA
jgi:hypothetical protein